MSNIGYKRTKEILANKRKQKKDPLRYLSRNDRLRLMAQGWSKEYLDTILKDGKVPDDFIQNKIKDAIQDNDNQDEEGE